MQQELSWTCVQKKLSRARARRRSVERLGHPSLGAARECWPACGPRWAGSSIWAHLLGSEKGGERLLVPRISFKAPSSRFFRKADGSASPFLPQSLTSHPRILVPFSPPYSPSSTWSRSLPYSPNLIVSFMRRLPASTLLLQPVPFPSSLLRFCFQPVRVPFSF